MGQERGGSGFDVFLHAASDLIASREVDAVETRGRRRAEGIHKFNATARPSRVIPDHNPVDEVA